jgi:hypothetical protein
MQWMALTKLLVTVCSQVPHKGQHPEKRQGPGPWDPWGRLKSAADQGLGMRKCLAAGRLLRLYHFICNCRWLTDSP